jgi:hypothetical protein
MLKLTDLEGVTVFNGEDELVCLREINAELLAALESVDRVVFDNITDYQISLMRQLIRAAIAKARGETP